MEGTRPPWFRFGPLSRPAAPAPAPTSVLQPRAAFGRPPPFRPPTLPQAPAPQPLPPPPPIAAPRPPPPPPATVLPTLPSTTVVPPATPVGATSPPAAQPPSPVVPASPPRTAQSPRTTAAPPSLAAAATPPALAQPPSDVALPSAAPASPRPPTAPPTPPSPASYRPPTAPPTPPAAVAPSPPPAAALPRTSVPTSPIKTTSSFPLSPSKITSPPSSAVVPVTLSTSLPQTPKPSTPAPSPKTRSPISAPPPSPSLSPPPLGSYVPSTSVATRAATPPSSPKTVQPLAKTPTESPKIRPISHPPSPLTLPSAQMKLETDREPQIPMEAEQKSVLVQETIEKRRVMPKTANGDQQRYVGEALNGSIAPHGKRDVTKDKGTHKKFSDSEEFGMRIITIAGENKGAIMELTSPCHKSQNFGSNSNYQNLYKKGNTKDKSDTGSGNEEGRSNVVDKSHNDNTRAMESTPTRTFMNSNVQGVNNSILYNCTFTDHDPGVHLSLSRKVNNGGGQGILLKKKNKD